MHYHVLRFAYLKAFLLDKDLSSIQVASFHEELLDVDVWSNVCIALYVLKPSAINRIQASYEQD